VPKVAFSLKTLQSLLWIIRHNEIDTINLYNSITPFVQVATGGNSNMLNFGYWSKNKKILDMNLMESWGSWGSWGSDLYQEFRQMV